MRILWILSICFLGTFHSYANFNIQSTQLDNGLKIVFIENHVVPAVYHSIWYKVGAKHEDEDSFGAAHFLEHMMFRGTEKFPEGSIGDLVHDGGGSYNAMTSEDYTVYYQYMPAQYLKQLMEIEADRMQNLKIDKKNLELERDIILQERKMRIDNNPVVQFFEQANKQFWQKDPRKYPIIGYENDIQNLKLEILQKFHQQYYVPNNATLVIIGATDFDTVKALAKKYFGNIGSRPFPEYIAPIEPDHPKAQQLQFSHARFLETSVNRWYLGPQKTGNGFQSDIVLGMLATILGGETGVLYQELVERRRLAYDVDFDLATSIHGGRLLYDFSAVCVDPDGDEELIAAFEGIIAEFINNPPSQEEIDHIAKRATNEVLLLNEQILQVGGLLGAYLMLGYNIDDLQNYAQQMQKITVKDIQDAAKQLFTTSKPMTITMKARGLK